MSDEMLPAIILPADPGFEHALSEGNKTTRKRALICGYVDFMRRCQEADDRTNELKALQALELLVLERKQRTPLERDTRISELKRVRDAVWSIGGKKDDAESPPSDTEH